MSVFIIASGFNVTEEQSEPEQPGESLQEPELAPPHNGLVVLVIRLLRL